MKRLSLLISFSLILFAFSAPGRADDARTVKAADFFPLIPDMEWHYDVTHSQGKQERKVPFRVKVEEGDYKYKGLSARSFKTRLASGRKRKEVLQREYYCFTKTGDLICYKRENGPVEVPLDPPQTILKASLKKGTTWTWKGTYKGRKANSTWKVVGFKKLILEKKNYDCIVVHQLTKREKSDVDQERTLWFAKGIGLVKEVALESGPNYKSKLTGVLKSYSRPADK